MRDDAPPVAHLGLAAVAGVLFLLGGQARLGDWGQVALRPLAGYVIAAVSLHAASHYVPQGAWARGAAWTVLLASTLHLSPLLRAEVLVPVAAAGVIDLLLHRRADEASWGAPATRKGKTVAGAATVATLILLAWLMLVARDALVLTRLGLVVGTAWALVATIALRPSLGTPKLLLGAAGTFSVVFFFLAAPVLPYGPLLAYVALVASVSLAILVATFKSTGPALAKHLARHEQTVRTLRDPHVAPLATRLERYLETGHGASTVSHRVEALLGRDEGGSLVPRLVEAHATGEATREDRITVLSSLLGEDVLEMEP